MLTRATRLKNVAFLVIGVLVLGYTGFRYADIGHYVGIRDYYTVKVHLAETGGLFTHSNVTYRGVSVGRVGPIGLTDDGVVAELRIDNSAPPIPTALQAVVANLSAVGEQYIDLRPTSTGAPYLGDGAVIEQPDTAHPGARHHRTDQRQRPRRISAAGVAAHGRRRVRQGLRRARRRPPGAARQRQRLRARRPTRRCPARPRCSRTARPCSAPRPTRARPSRPSRRAPRTWRPR